MQTDPAAQPTRTAQSENPEAGQATADAPPAPIPNWTIAQPNAELGFTAAYMGREFSGKFDEWSADIAFDPDRPEQDPPEGDLDARHGNRSDHHDACRPEQDRNHSCPDTSGCTWGVGLVDGSG